MSDINNNDIIGRLLNITFDSFIDMLLLVDGKYVYVR